MDTPKKLKVAVILLVVALLVLVGLSAWVVFQNYWWRRSVDLVADEAGVGEAKTSFCKGNLVMWEIDQTNDFPRFSGRRDGPFDVWLVEYHAGMPSPWQYAQRRKIEAHNSHMRFMYDHPERFNKDSLPLQRATNNVTK